MALQSRTTAVGNLQDDTSGNNYAVNKAVYVLKLDKTLAQIYSAVDSNFNGTTPIIQDGVNNVTDSRGEFTYWVEAGDYIERVGANERRVSITGADYFNNRIEETENAIIDAVAGRGAYYPVGSFEAGFTYTDINQVGTFGTAPNITYYVYTGGLTNLPHAVSAGTDPTVSADYEQVFYGSIQQLSGIDQQSDLDKYYARKVGTIYDMIQSDKIDSYIYNVQGYMAENDGYKGEWIYDSSKSKSHHDGSKVISPTVPWNGSQVGQEDWINGVGETDPTGNGCFVLNEKSNQLVSKLKDFSNLYGFEDKVITLFAGVDSLTDGAGGQGGRYDDSYFNIVTNSLREHFGDAGAGWTAFDNRHAAREGMNFSRSTDLAYIKTLTRGVYPSVYSLDFCGLHNATATTSSTCLLGWLGAGNENRDWDTATIYYLIQPSGGTFEAYQTGVGNVPVSVDTSGGSFAIGSVTLNKVSTLANQIQVDVTVAGAITLFGIYWERSVDVGVVCSRLALGGYQTAWYANDLDPTFQQNWLSLLNPTHYIINGGRNDIGNFTPQEFIDNVETYLSYFPATTQKMIISPNESSTDNTTAPEIREYRSLGYKLAYDNGYAYINNAEVLGNYVEADKKGWMLDTTHPSTDGNWIIAKNVLDYIGVPMYKWSQPTQYNQVTDNSPIYRNTLIQGIQQNITPSSNVTMYELDCVGPATYILEMKVMIKNASGTGMKSSTHKIRVVADVANIVSIGTLTTDADYDDGSMTETYTVLAAITPSNTLRISLTANAGNTNNIQAVIYGEYFATNLLAVNGERWTVVD